MTYCYYCSRCENPKKYTTNKTQNIAVLSFENLFLTTCFFCMPSPKRILTPWKINMEPTNHPWKERNMIFQTPMIMFHVNPQGCKIYRTESFVYKLPCTPCAVSIDWRTLSTSSGVQHALNVQHLHLRFNLFFEVSPFSAEGSLQALQRWTPWFPAAKVRHAVPRVPRFPL